MTLDEMTAKAAADGWNAYFVNANCNPIVEMTNPYPCSTSNLELRLQCFSWRLGFFEAICADGVHLLESGIVDENGDLK